MDLYLLYKFFDLTKIYPWVSVRVRFGLGLKDVPTWVTGSYDTPLDRAFKELSNGPISSVQIL